MADIYTTLKTRTNQDNVYPNITTANIPTGAVETAKIADGAVTSVKIADGAVSGSKIATGGVATANIQDTAITTAKISDSAVTTDKIDDDAVTEDKIQNSAVTHSKLDIDAVWERNILDGSITFPKLTRSSVSIADIYTTYANEVFSKFIIIVWDLMTNPYIRLYRDYKPSASVRKIVNWRMEIDTLSEEINLAVQDQLGGAFQDYTIDTSIAYQLGTWTDLMIAFPEGTLDQYLQ